MSAPILSIFNALLKNRIDIINALASPPPPQRFIVGHLPEEHGVYGLLIGPDGSRKSWLVLHISLGVAGGRPIAIGPDGTYLWEAPERGRVVYLASEDSANVLIRRIWSIAQLPGYEWVRDADEFLDIVPTYSSLSLLSLDSDGRPVKTTEFDALCEYAKGARLIVIDPLADFFDISESDDRAARGAVALLRELSRITGAGVLGVHHQNKIGMMNGQTNHQSGRGSSRFGAGCRWAVVLQALSTEKGKENGVSGDELQEWTLVHESKASYCAERTPLLSMKRHVITDENGRVVTSAPASAEFADAEEVKRQEIEGDIEKGKSKNTKKRGKNGIEPDEHEMGGEIDEFAGWK